MVKKIFHTSNAIKFSGDTDSLKVVFSEDRKSVGFIADFPASAFDIEELVIYENIEQIPDEEVDIIRKTIGKKKESAAGNEATKKSN